MSQSGSDASTHEPGISKEEFRARALDRRSRLADKERASQAACRRMIELPEYSAAEVVLAYFHIGDEVRTTDLVRDLLDRGKKIAAPCCVGRELHLYRVAAVHDLAEGVWGIPEPNERVRSDRQRRMEPGELDLLAVPGLAFDARGGRVGYGRGYFDRLLERIRSDAVAVGLAFECQVFESVPMYDHDVPVHLVVTDRAVYRH